MCEQMGRVMAATDVDHIKPFHGKHDRLRLDTNNLQSLCHECHSSAKQRQDVSGVLVGADVQGNPIDPAHHWNTKA